MRNIKMIVQYDGSNFKGFQRLKDNDNTVQGKIEDVLNKLTNESIEIITFHQDRSLYSFHLSKVHRYK